MFKGLRRVFDAGFSVRDGVDLIGGSVERIAHFNRGKGVGVRIKIHRGNGYAGRKIFGVFDVCKRRGDLRHVFGGKIPALLGNVQNGLCRRYGKPCDGFDKRVLVGGGIGRGKQGGNARLVTNKGLVLFGRKVSCADHDLALLVFIRDQLIQGIQDAAFLIQQYDIAVSSHQLANEVKILVVKHLVPR